jgi:hypothetical protein
MHVRPARVLLVLLPLISSAPAFAQSVTTMEGIPLRTTMVELLKPLAAAPVGEAVALATAIEVTTAPLGTSSGGFVFKLDPTTGLQVRTASTFGPSFAERVLTTGSGKMSVGASLAVATYDKLGDFNLSQMQLSSISASSPIVSRTGNASLVLSSETLVMTGAVGATDNLDLGVSVPMVKVKLDGLSWVKRGDDTIVLRAAGGGIASGLGDIAVMAKYRFLRFGKQQPDPGGLGFQVLSRLPTGNRENLRGLGINRVLASLLFSSGQGKFRPHANGGFEWWEKGLVVQSGLLSSQTVTVRHQVQYAAGAEFEAAPKVTLLVDFLGRQVLGGGRIDTLTYNIPPGNNFGVDTFQAAGITDHAIRKLMLVPGFKWNVRGSFVLALNARIPVFDNSLYDKFTPVVGLDWTF